MGKLENVIECIEKAMLFAEGENERMVTIGYGVMEDALTLLREQEPVKPYAVYSEHTGAKWLVCGACDEPMNNVRDEIWSNYCPNCGRAVKWE